MYTGVQVATSCIRGVLFLGVSLLIIFLVCTLNCYVCRKVSVYNGAIVTGPVGPVFTGLFSGAPKI